MQDTTLTVTLTVNGKPASARVEARTTLVQFLRETLHMTGTHVGCDTCQCGCCTVLMDDDAVKSCTILAAQAEGASITTIEGLEDEDGTLHPMQEAFTACHGLQCGYCTPGMIMSSVEMVAKYPDLDDAKIRALLDGNMCRCTGYHNIVKAIQSVADAGGANG
ncbi:MAG: (2Fe-2S)-binding protein [Pseudomonadota bacterium]|nr:(2Fe-2S)-binding protein [Pseudomonadota bacterium]